MGYSWSSVGTSISYPLLINWRIETAPHVVILSALSIREHTAKFFSRAGQRLVTDVYRQYLSPSNPHLADVLHKRHMYSYGLDPKRWLRCTNHLSWRRATCDFLWNDTAKFAFQTTSWSGCKLKTVSLRTPHRHEGDEGWFNKLSEIRRGVVSPRTLAYLKTLNREPDVSNSPIKPVLLHTRRKGVAFHNLKELAQLPGRSYNYTAMDVERYVETPSHQSHDLSYGGERVIRELDTKDSGTSRQSNIYIKSTRAKPLIY